MENCEEVFSLLSQYLDLELAPDAAREIDAHLADCAPCIEFMKSLRATVDLCRKYSPEELPKPIGDRAKTQLLAAYEKMLDEKPPVTI